MRLYVREVTGWQITGKRLNQKTDQKNLKFVNIIVTLFVALTKYLLSLPECKYSPAKCHALCVTLTHFDFVSRSHA